jgi:hypothetical protein
VVSSAAAPSYCPRRRSRCRDRHRRGSWRHR